MRQNAVSCNGGIGSGNKVKDKYLVNNLSSNFTTTVDQVTIYRTAQTAVTHNKEKITVSKKPEHDLVKIRH